MLDETLFQLKEDSLLKVPLFNSKFYNNQKDVQIGNASICYIIESNSCFK